MNGNVKETLQQDDNHLHSVVEDDQFEQPIQTCFLLSHKLQKDPFSTMNLITKPTFQNQSKSTEITPLNN